LIPLGFSAAGAASFVGDHQRAAFLRGIFADPL